MAYSTPTALRHVHHSLTKHNNITLQKVLKLQYDNWPLPSWGFCCCFSLLMCSESFGSRVIRLHYRASIRAGRWTGLDSEAAESCWESLMASHSMGQGQKIQMSSAIAENSWEPRVSAAVAAEVEKCFCQANFPVQPQWYRYSRSEGSRTLFCIEWGELANPFQFHNTLIGYFLIVPFKWTKLRGRITK